MHFCFTNIDKNLRLSSWRMLSAFSNLLLAFIKCLGHINQPQNGIAHQSVKRQCPILKQKALRIHHVKETWSTLKKFEAEAWERISIALKTREWGSVPRIKLSFKTQKTTGKNIGGVSFLQGPLLVLALCLPGRRSFC